MLDPDVNAHARLTLPADQIQMAPWRAWSPAMAGESTRCDHTAAVMVCRIGVLPDAEFVLGGGGGECGEVVHDDHSIILNELIQPF